MGVGPIGYWLTSPPSPADGLVRVRVRPSCFSLSLLVSSSPRVAVVSSQVAPGHAGHIGYLEDTGVTEDKLFYDTIAQEEAIVGR
jgi:hypothetical protein